MSPIQVPGREIRRWSWKWEVAVTSQLRGANSKFKLRQADKADLSALALPPAELIYLAQIIASCFALQWAESTTALSVSLIVSSLHLPAFVGGIRFPPCTLTRSMMR